MVRANELRIGNWILDDNNKLVQVDSIIMDGDSIYINSCIIDGNIDLWISDPQPIPLTPEILEKRCGFEVSQYIGTGDFYISGSKIIKAGNYNYEIVVFAIDYDTWLLKYITNPLFDKSLQKEITVSLLPFQYLHQLQNIWLDFTGQELEIKELKHA